MSLTKTFVYSLVVLALFQVIYAEEEFNQKAGWQFPSFTGFSSGSLGGIDLPFFGSGFTRNNSGLSGLPFNFPSHDGLSSIPDLGGTLSPPSSNSSATEEPTGRRKRREVDESESRSVFRFPTVKSCNYTMEAGLSCPTCTEALICFQNNLGLSVACWGLLPYCNNGHCSHTESETCRDTNSTSSTEPLD